MMTTTVTPSNEDVVAFSKLIRGLSTDCHSLFTSSTSILPSHLPLPQKDDGSSSTTPNPSSSDPFLSLKSLLLLSYTQHLFLLSSHRALGLSIVDDQQGKELVQRLVRMRVTLDKMKLLEARLKPKWERLVRAAQTFKPKRTSGDREDDGRGEDGGRTGPNEDDDEEDGDLDPLAFRPNPSALLGSTSKSTTSSPATTKSTSNHKGRSEEHDDDETSSSRAGVYRPPKLAPMPYSDRPRSKSRRGGEDVSSDEEARGSHRTAAVSGARYRGVNSHLLSDLKSSLSSNPHATSSTGLASLSSADPAASSRAKRLREMDEYEESNFTRLVLSKKDERRRRRDEEDVVLGGVTTAGLGRRAGGGDKVGAGLEEEFGDLLRGGERRGGPPGAAPGAHERSRREWDKLTKKRKTAPVGEFEGRRRSRNGGGAAGGKGGGGKGSGGGNRFEKAVASHNKKRR